MAAIFEDLKPKDVFKYFEIISSIPRGSGSEKALSDYMLKFAESLGLWARQDEAYNIYIKKPASSGCEQAPTVILQGHMDMVCEKNKDVQHDFQTEGLRLVIEDDFIKADGTSLGADNGVAIAYQMAVLADSSLKHPPLEILMTTDEERGMTGASHIHSEYLDGKMLINLDTDVEGEFLVSCAGGIKANIELQLQYEALSASKDVYRLLIGGLLGGHSGADIHLERANAHILMGRVLHELRKHGSFLICDLIGGSKDNVITRECECVIALKKEAISVLEEVIAKMNKLFQKEYAAQDPRVTLSVIREKEQWHNSFSPKLSDDIIDLLLIIPNGIISFDQSIKGLVETSLNLGILQKQGEVLCFGSAIRSSLASKKQAIIDQLEVISKKINGKWRVMGNYPAWEYCQNSQLRELSLKVYHEMYQKTPEIKAIHAGLECGFISEKLLGLDMISFGPNIYDIHSPNERVNISSMSRVYEYLTRLLENITTY